MVSSVLGIITDFSVEDLDLVIYSSISDDLVPEKIATALQLF